MGSTNEVLRLIQDRLAKKGPIMVVSTCFGEWPLYGLYMKRRRTLHLPGHGDPLRRPASGVACFGQKKQRNSLLARHPLDSESHNPETYVVPLDALRRGGRRFLCTAGRVALESVDPLEPLHG